MKFTSMQENILFHNFAEAIFILHIRFCKVTISWSSGRFYGPPGIFSEWFYIGHLRHESDNKTDGVGTGGVVVPGKVADGLSGGIV